MDKRKFILEESAILKNEIAKRNEALPLVTRKTEILTNRMKDFQYRVDPSNDQLKLKKGHIELIDYDYLDD